MTFKWMRATLAALALAFTTMPATALDLNSRGVAAMGTGSMGVSVGGQTIASSAGGAGWLTDDEVSFQHCHDGGCHVQIYDARSGVIRDASERGANAIEAGGGLWAAWLSGYGVYTSRGDYLPEAGLLSVGPGGELGIRPQYHGAGLSILLPGGGSVPITGDPTSYAQLLGGTRAVWTVGTSLRSAGLPALVQVGQAWRPRAVDVGGEWWITYYSDRAGGIVLHPFGSLRGYVVIGGGAAAFGHDAVALAPGVVRVAWAVNEGELPEDYRQRDVRLDEPREDLARFLIDTPPIDPPHNPPVEEPPASVQAMPANQSATVTAVMRAHPEINACDEGQRGAIVDYAAQRLNKAAGAVVWGRKSRNREGTDLNTDGLTFRFADGSFVIFDAISGAPPCSATWEVFGPFAPGGNGFWVPPQLGPEPTSGGSGPVNPPAGDSATVTALKARIAALESAEGELKRVIDGLRAEIEVANGRAADAERERDAARSETAQALDAAAAAQRALANVRCEAKAPAWLKISCRVIR